MDSREMMLHTGFLLVYLWNLCHASFHANELNFSDKTKRNCPGIPFCFFVFFFRKKKLSLTFRQIAVG